MLPRISTVPPPHPGALLRDRVLPGLALSVSQAARELDVARQTLHRVLAGTASISPEMAARLSRLSGTAPQFWLALQHEHDLWHVEHSLADALARIPARTLPQPLRTEIDRRHDR